MLKTISILCASSSLAILARAGELASPTAAGVPTHAGTLAASKAGAYLKFRQTQSAGGQSQVLTLWQVHRGVAADVATVQVVLTNRAWTRNEPLTEAAQDVQIADQAVAIQGTLLDFETPAGVTLVSDSITKLPAETLAVGPRSIECQVFERVTKLEVPQGAVQLRNRLWWSSEVPVSGLVRIENETTGLQEGTSVVELVAFSGMNDPDKVRVTDPQWFLAQARAAMRDSGENEHQLDRFLDDLGDGYLAHGLFDQALATVSEIKNSVYQESLVAALRVFAAVDDGPGQRVAVGLVDAEEVDMGFSSFGNQYGNHLERMSIADVEKLAARIASPDYKAAPWSALFCRMLLKGDREHALAAFQRISTPEGQDAALAAAAYEAKEARRLDVLTLAASIHPAGAATSSFLGSQYALLDELGREKEALEVARRYADAVVKLPESDRLVTTNSALMLALYRPWSRVEPYVGELLRAKDPTGDPEAEFAAATKAGDVRGGVWAYAQLAGERGDDAAAKRILAADAKAKSSDALGAITALYAAGKKAEATAWVRSLAPGQGEDAYIVEGTRARACLRFSDVESWAGDTAEEARWLDEAEKAAIAAQRAIAAYNTEHKTSRYWEGGVSLQSSAPFVLVGARLVARGEHERALEIARQSPSLMPGSSCVEDFWKHLGVTAGKRGDAEFAAKVVAGLPASMDANRRNWFVRDMARAFATGDTAAAAKFIAGLGDELQRNLATSSLIVQLCLDGKTAQAEAVFAPWIVKQDPKQWADAKVALAMAEASAGDAVRARELFLAPRFATEFVVAGLERENVLISVGYHAAKAKPDLDFLGQWLVGVESAYERAYLALGMALGLAPGPVPDEFADPVEYSRF